MGGGDTSPWWQSMLADERTGVWLHLVGRGKASGGGQEEASNGRGRSEKEVSFIEKGVIGPGFVFGEVG